MSYNYDWDEILDVYVKRIAAPDGRDTFESTTELVSDIIKIAELKSSDTLIDIGSGWGNTAIPLSQKVSHITGIEPDKKNIGEAEKRTQNLQIKNIQYIRGSFEKPNCNITADKIISSLAFHQVAYGKRKKALSNIKKLLSENGKFILCDTCMFFDTEHNSELFNKVYRYVLAKTTPTKIYDKYIKPHMEKDLSYIYTWADMKKYTPKKSRFYSENDLEKLLTALNMKITKKKLYTPFFGIAVIEHAVCSARRRFERPNARYCIQAECSRLDLRRR